MKTYRGSGGIAPVILNLDNRRGEWLTSRHGCFTQEPFEWVAGWALEAVWKLRSREKSRTPAGNRAMSSHYTNWAIHTSVFSTKSDNGPLGTKAWRVVRYQRESRPLCHLPSDNTPSAPITTLLRFLPRTICAVFFLRFTPFTFYLKQDAAQSDLFTF